MPVIFLPNDGTDDKDCDATDDSKMSSFGFMSFAIAVVNAVINNANNVNNNNNNNNNNDNNNNNNIGNINIANSNNDVNNMNMVTAGRRRMLLKSKGKEAIDKNNVYSYLIPIWSSNISMFHQYTDLNMTSRENEPIKTISIGYINFNNDSLNHQTISAKSYWHIKPDWMQIFDDLTQWMDASKLVLTNFLDKFRVSYNLANFSFQKLIAKMSSMFEIISRTKSFMKTIVQQFSYITNNLS